MYEQGEHSQIYQPEFNGRSPGESLELSAFSEQSYEQAEYSQYTDYPQQDHNEQRPAERSLEQPGHPVGSAKQTPSQGAHSRAGPATEKQSAPRTQPNAGHPNTHQRTASGPPRQPQPGRSGVPISKPIPAHIPQRSIHSSPLAHPPQFNPAQPPRAIPAPSPRPGAPQPNPLQNPQAFPYTQHRSNQQHPARQVTPQTSPQMHSNRSPNIQNLPPQHVQLPNSHQIPGRGHPTQVQVRRPSSPHNAQRPFAGRPISPHHSIGQTHSLGAPHTPMHQVTTLPSRNPGAGPAKPMPNPHQPPHQPPHAAVPYNMSSPQNLVSGSLHHTQQSPVSTVSVTSAAFNFYARCRYRISL
jgi:hypothetical protein